jgi:uncharacterized protein YhfF
MTVNSTESACAAYWYHFAERSASIDSSEGFEIDVYGDNPRMADELAGLIMDGKKTATCSLLYEYQRDDEPLPQVGRKQVVVNGDGHPVCITETTDVEVKRFDEVDEDFAHAEGEGDRTRASWARVHQDFFERILAKEGRTFGNDTLLVCVRFKVLHR